MIIFKKIRFKNFFSTGDEFSEIDLNKNPTTLIMGKNGSGKSTMLDALTYACYGTTFRNMVNTAVINDTNSRDMLVELEFSIGKKSYFVRRGLKPRIFEIYENGKLIDQDSKSRDYQKYLEQNILKLSKKTFMQVVVLGSASFVPFMQLTAAERRFIIENLLDIEVFSAMNIVLKSKILEMKDEYNELSNSITMQTEKIALIEQYLHKIKADNTSAISQKQKTIEENEQQKELILLDIGKLKSIIEEKEKEVLDKEKVHTKIQKLTSSKSKLFDAKTKAEKEKVFYLTSEICPTCQQEIQPEFIKNTVSKKNDLIIEIESALVKLQTDLQKSENRLIEINGIWKAIAQNGNEISTHQSSIFAIDKYIKKVHSEIETLLKKGNDAPEQQEKLIRLEKELIDLNVQRDALVDKKHYLDIVGMMLKDSGIKTKIIRQYLPIINKYVNKYFSEMDFFATFKLDENFKEIIHIRGSKERGYTQLSEGQKLRIDLAVLFTWREIAKLKNSADTNLLIMDEIFEKSLDSEGVDDLMRMIHTLSKGVNVFIISPQGDSLLDKFSNAIRFVDHQGFSVMEQI